MLTFFETADRAQALGIKYLEAYPGQALKPGSKSKVGPGLTDAEVAELQAKLKQNGLKLVAFGDAVNWCFRAARVSKRFVSKRFISKRFRPLPYGRGSEWHTKCTGALR